MKPGARLAAAIELLDEIQADGRGADRVVEHYFRRRRYAGSGDRAAVTGRVYRILRHRRRLDWMIAAGGDAIAASARALVLADAALNDAPEAPATLAALFDGGRFAPDPLTPEERVWLDGVRAVDSAGLPAPVRLECPDWLWPSLRAHYGAEACPLLGALRAEAPVDLRINPRVQPDRAAAIAGLAAAGIEAVPTALSPFGIRLARRRPVRHTKPFRSGAVEIQSEGSQLVAMLVGAKPGMQVADYCAGAGGKALLLAALMRNRGRVLALDVAPARLKQAADRFKRARTHNVERRLLDPEAGAAPADLAGAFDRVLVDAPCTGSGTWRRNPDARWRYDAAALAAMISLQDGILDRAAGLVKPAGRLVYAVCSLSPQEGEDRIASFLARRPDFARLDPGALWRETVAAQGGAPAPAGFAADSRLQPHREGTDGFLIAALRREG